MQIQASIFDAPQTKSPTLVSVEQANASHNVEAQGPVEGVEKAQNISSNDMANQTDLLDKDVLQQGQHSEPQLPTQEQVASRVDAKLQYEKQTQSNDSAVAQYLTTQHAQEREAIQQMVGIDIYA
ncbi:hypothetical protein FM038_010505 [Shewanella eurypsychrophilus]|uniref:Uncharacterized protein n=1 Tax=Shewanella eurypsychrophilus TaxID=2593656 RepID=A0ABX6V5E5_9GAMM|nr:MULTISPECIES: hypothetical protein [Shewanella]QFU22547.1 hypothetical protein FS418_12085 [Shewanella sp. YLB-09]QPG57836.1 hypothetical protein FM038_010505 [Shewanella eurypsychrophilus]